MNIISWVIFGAMTGWGAAMLVGTRLHLLFDVSIGIVGALIGGWLMTEFGFGTPTAGFNMYSFVVSIFGAAFMLWASRTVKFY